MAEDTQPDVEVNVKQKVLDILENGMSGMFGVRANTDEAFEYAMSIAKAEGMEGAYMATALIVYHNSLLKQLMKVIEQDV